MSAEPPGGALLPNLVLFGRVLRRAGLDVHTGRLIDAVRALAYVDLGRRADVHHTLAALLVHRHEDLVLFDRAFDAFWRKRGGHWGRSDLRALGEQRSGIKLRFTMPGFGEDGWDEQPQEPSEPLEVPRPTWSAREALRQKNFASYTAEEIAEASAAMASLAWNPGERRTRRWRIGSGPSPDIRAALRRAGRSGGELIVLPRKARRRRPRPLVIIADVSGSMERYTRMLLRFVHALVRRRKSVEAFLFATRVTRITRDLKRERADEAVSAVARHVEDWAGGTRIGDALREVNRHWARRVLGRGPVVLLISDGWDRGDPALLSAEIARLQRSCHRLIWLNPLLGSPDYEPLTRGMRAARPFIDDFLPAHNLASVERLAAHLDNLPARRPVRRSTPWTFTQPTPSTLLLRPSGIS
ncbi:MAG TPA: VWA domain-containing protein [Vicinamibacterales bacterium]|nr:VWA domain-containing protein [Vicinamibacterales bacterium]